MQIVETSGNDRLARVFVGQLSDGSLIEFAESVQPPIPREDKWVLIVSTLKGCPVRCPICDAGADYRGKLSSSEILEQIAVLVRSRYPDGRVPARKFKIQFARMGDPALNPAVLEVLEHLPAVLNAPGLMPSISTIAPRGTHRFLDDLLRIKRHHYPGGKFQMQFSLHTTDEVARQKLIPARTMSFAQMAEYGMRWHEPGDRKIALNFAAVRGFPLDPKALARVFPSSAFMVKLTPVNPTQATKVAGLESLLDPSRPDECEAHAQRFRDAGFDTILSIGEQEENLIGSNCGMLVRQISTANKKEYRLSNGLSSVSIQEANIGH